MADPWVPDGPRHDAIADLENTLLAGVEHAFTDYLAAVEAAILDGDTSSVTAADRDNDPPDMGAWPPLHRWVQAIIDWIIPGVRKAWRHGWERTTTPEQRATLDSSDYVDAHIHDTTTRLTNASWTDEVYNRVRDAIREGHDSGEGARATRHRVREALGREQYRGQALTIARTETMTGIATGAYQAGKARENIFGQHLYKTWQATNDDRTRLDHREADQQSVPSDEHFTVGGEQMLYPHDPAASPSQTVNCRCDLLWETAEEAGMSTTTADAGGWDESAKLRRPGGQFTNAEALAAPAPVGPPAHRTRSARITWTAHTASRSDADLTELSPDTVEAVLAETDVITTGSEFPAHVQDLARNLADRVRRLNPATTEPENPATTEPEPVTAAGHMPRQLRDYWTHGEGAAKIRWGTGGDFNRCRRQLREYVDDDDELDGLCANLHKSAIGVWPGQEASAALPAASTTVEQEEPDMTTPAPVTAKASGSTDLPLADRSTEWDSSDAQSALLKWADGDADKLGRAFFWQDPSKDASTASAYKLPFAKPMDGNLKAVPEAIFAVAAALNGARGGVDIPDDDVSAVKNKVAAYYKKMNMKAPWNRNSDSDSKQGSVALTASLSWADLVATAAPAEPPADWFTNPQLTGPTKIMVTDEGRVYGHIAAWGVEHSSMPGVTAPHDPYGGSYPRFHRHPVRTADGGRVKTGPLATAGHADLQSSIGAVIEHYDDPTFIAADVVAGEDAHGIWVSGAVRHGASPFQVTMLDRYSISGDWRDGELIAACSVSAPGFHLDADDNVTALAAAAGHPTPRVEHSRPRARMDQDGYMPALIAASVVTADVQNPPMTGERLYAEFKEAQDNDRRAQQARDRLYAPAVAAAAARIRSNEGGQ